MPRNFYGFRQLAASLPMLAAVACAATCHEPDPRSIEGALDAASRTTTARDARRLFRLVDQRARHALASIVKDRVEAAALVTRDYPESERARALAALGDAARATDAADLFARRCNDACLDALGQRLGAPVRSEPRGDETVVHTARGESLHLHRGTDGWWGLVWNTLPLSQERDRAAQDLAQIRINADHYRARRALEAAAR